MTTTKTTQAEQFERKQYLIISIWVHIWSRVDYSCILVWIFSSLLLYLKQQKCMNKSHWGIKEQENAIAKFIKYISFISTAQEAKIIEMQKIICSQSRVNKN